MAEYFRIQLGYTTNSMVDPDDIELQGKDNDFDFNQRRRSSKSVSGGHRRSILIQEFLRENHWEHIDKKEIAAAAEKKAMQNKRQPTKDTKNFIQKLFGAYSDVKNKEDAKKGQGDPNYFEFNIDNYIIKNVAIPNYLETDIN